MLSSWSHLQNDDGQSPPTSPPLDDVNNSKLSITKPYIPFFIVRKMPSTLRLPFRHGFTWYHHAGRLILLLIHCSNGVYTLQYWSWQLLMLSQYWFPMSLPLRVQLSISILNTPSLLHGNQNINIKASFMLTFIMSRMLSISPHSHSRTADLRAQWYVSRLIITSPMPSTHTSCRQYPRHSSFRLALACASITCVKVPSDRGLVACIGACFQEQASLTCMPQNKLVDYMSANCMPFREGKIQKERFRRMYIYCSCHQYSRHFPCRSIDLGVRQHKIPAYPIRARLDKSLARITFLQVA